ARKVPAPARAFPRRIRPAAEPSGKAPPCADTIGCRAVWDARSMSQDLARRPHPPPAWLDRDYHAGEVSAYPRTPLAPLVPTCGRVPTARSTVSFLGPVGRS